MVKTRHVPERSCVACGQKLPKRQLTRIVRKPQGAVTVDPSGKAPGRGAYLCTSQACWQRGVQKGGLERGLRISIPSQDRERLLAFYQEQIQEQIASSSLER